MHLIRDLKTYQDTISTFSLPALSERFEFLRQLGNVFLVRPEILKSYITENYLGRIEPSLLRPYLEKREDWAQFERQFDFGSVTTVGGAFDEVPGTPPATGSLSTTGFAGALPNTTTIRERLNAVGVSNRLSMMMRDLENVRIGGSTMSMGLGDGSSSRFSLHGLQGLSNLNFPSSYSFQSGDRTASHQSSNLATNGHGSAL